MRQALRHKLYEAITGTRGDKVAAIRIGKDFARFANDLLGSPLVPKPKEASAAPAHAAPAAPKAREPAPVMLYVEWDSPGRDEVEQLLKKHGVAYKVLALDHDDATKAFVLSTAKREPPVLFIAAEVVGWIDELKALEESGELEKRVFGS